MVHTPVLTFLSVVLSVSVMPCFSGSPVSANLLCAPQMQCRRKKQRRVYHHGTSDACEASIICGGVAKVMNIFRSVFLASAVGICVATTLASLDVSVEPSNEPLVVPKTVVSSRLRFVFTVGLEGTGHHYVGEVKHHLFETNKELVGVSRDENINPKFYNMGHAMGGSAEHYTAVLDAAKENMRGLAETASDFEAPGTIVFMSGKNSYPNGPGPDKALQYMDLRMIAEVAEMEGVDLRVLYLRRSVKDTLIANTIHRHFQT